jgi:hypothetical protein
VSAYLVTISGDESDWEARTHDEWRAVDDAHRVFHAALLERGHRVVASHQLTHSREAKVARGDGVDVRVTDGPFAETVEQIGGFYVIDTSDVDDLMRLVTELAGTERAVEVRPTVDHSGGAS